MWQTSFCPRRKWEMSSYHSVMPLVRSICERSNNTCENKTKKHQNYRSKHIEEEVDDTKDQIHDLTVLPTIPMSFLSLVWNILLFFTDTSSFLVRASSSSISNSNLQGGRILKLKLTLLFSTQTWDECIQLTCLQRRGWRSSSWRGSSCGVSRTGRAVGRGGRTSLCRSHCRGISSCRKVMHN